MELKGKKGLVTHVESVEDVARLFEKEKTLFIDCSDASPEQIEMLGDLLTRLTEMRPHEGRSYEQHIIRFRRSFPFLFCKESCAVSTDTPEYYKEMPFTMSVEDVLSLDPQNKNAIQDSDFDGIF